MVGFLIVAVRSQIVVKYLYMAIDWCRSDDVTAIAADGESVFADQKMS